MTWLQQQKSKYATFNSPAEAHCNKRTKEERKQARSERKEFRVCLLYTSPSPRDS